MGTALRVSSVNTTEEYITQHLATTFSQMPAPLQRLATRLRVLKLQVRVRPVHRGNIVTQRQLVREAITEVRTFLDELEADLGDD